jgi:SAM-dependent methyltransferase
MNTSNSVVDLSLRAPALLCGDRRDLSTIIAFFTATDGDFGAWSRDFNMHFGFHEWGMSLLDREAMLDRMNAKVVERLSLPAGLPARVADLGCGTGATARTLVRLHPGSRVSAVTVVADQIARGLALNIRSGTGAAIDFVLRDFADTGLPANAYDAVYAIESACYESGPDKRRIVEEASRLLKPGGRLVIADCFIKSLHPMHWLVRAAYRRWCASWAVPGLPDVAAVSGAMGKAGFTDVEFTDISWNVAPSVAHVPYVATRFLISELIKGRGRLSAWRRKHIAASWLSIWLGLCRATLGYYLVSARKAG